MKKIKIGDKLYIPSAYYVYRGQDDLRGGLAEVEAFNDYGFVLFKENPGVAYNLEHLLPSQKILKKEFGCIKAKKIPDNRPEFNQPEADWV